MYPRVSDFIYDVFGIDLPIPIQSYGLFVALAFITGGYFIMLELKRKTKEGKLLPQKKKVLVGEAPRFKDFIYTGLISFFIGFKLLGIILNYSHFYNDPQDYILSIQGNIFGGLIAAAVSIFFTYKEKIKQKLDKPSWVEEEIKPYQLTGNIILIGVIASILGAKIFHNLENLDEFSRDPIEAIFSFSGLTFYGGLIVCTITLLWYGKKNGIPPLILADTAAPAVMLGYAIGRIGCQVSGDGDWGILNSAYISDINGSAIAASLEQFKEVLNNNAAYYVHQFGSIESVPHITVKAFWGLPDFLFAYSYPNNVLNEGANLANCSGKYCSYLPVPVFPTPFYETTICTIFFVVLWLIRKKITIDGLLFSIYLSLNGLERFFVEKIRVNEVYVIFGNKITQAEIISTILFLIGIFGIVYFTIFHRKKDKKSTLP